MKFLSTLLLLVGLATPAVSQQTDTTTTTVLDSVPVISYDYTRTITTTITIQMAALDTITDSAKVVMPQHITIDNLTYTQVNSTDYEVTVLWTPDQWVDSLYIRPNDAGVVPYQEQWLYAGNLTGASVLTYRCGTTGAEIQSRSYRNDIRSHPALRVPVSFGCSSIVPPPPVDTTTTPTPPPPPPPPSIALLTEQPTALVVLAHGLQPLTYSAASLSLRMPSAATERTTTIPTPESTAPEQS